MAELTGGDKLRAGRPTHSLACERLCARSRVQGQACRRLCVVAYLPEARGGGGEARAQLHLLLLRGGAESVRVLRP